MRHAHTLLTPLRSAWRGWMAFSHVLGLVMSTILLTVLWVVGFGTYGIALGISNMFKRTAPATSYWKTATPQRREDLLRQS